MQGYFHQHNKKCKNFLHPTAESLYYTLYIHMLNPIAESRMDFGWLKATGLWNIF